MASEVGPSGTDRIATDLRGCIGRIIAEWEGRLRERVAAARHERVFLLVNTLPEFLERLADALDPREPADTAAGATTLPVEHGRERARLTSFSIEDVFDEIVILRDVLLEELAPREGFTARHKAVVLASIDDQMRRTLRGYVDFTEETREHFVHALSHDFKTPLAAIRLGSQILKSGLKPEEREHHPAASIEKSAERLGAMVAQLLDFGRLRCHRMPLTFADYDLAGLAHEAVDELRALFPGNRFELRAPPALHVHWDREGTRRIIENLCSNAVKYGADGTPVRVEVRAAHERVRLSVHNEGNPIPEEEQPLVFHAYHRGEDKTGRSVGGWGLGLAFVKEFSERHGGSVVVDSREGKGTTFTVDLPADPRGVEGQGVDRSL